MVLAAPVPVVEEPFGQRPGHARAARRPGRQPDHGVGPLGRGPQQRPEPSEGGQPAGQARRVHPARVRRVAGHAVRAPAACPLVGQDDLGPLGACVGGGPPVMVRRHLEAPEIEALGVHPPRRHRDDVGVTGPAEQWAEQPRQAERRQHGGGHGELAAIGGAPVRRVERAGRMDQHIEPFVRRGDAGGEPLHGNGIGDVEHDRRDRCAGAEITRLACGGLGPARVAADEPHGRPQPRQLQRRRPADPRGRSCHDRHPAREIARRLPVLEARPRGVARPAEAAGDAHLERGVDQSGQLGPAHARARRKPSAPRSAILRNDRAMTGAARRSTPRPSSTAT